MQVSDNERPGLVHLLLAIEQGLELVQLGVGVLDHPKQSELTTLVKIPSLSKGFYRLSSVQTTPLQFGQFQVVA